MALLTVLLQNGKNILIEGDRGGRFSGSGDGSHPQEQSSERYLYHNRLGSLQVGVDYM
jgi:hypothetical protein